MTLLFVLFLVLSLSSFLGWLYLVVPQKMAHSRNRSAFGWILISLVATPIVAISGLYWLGMRTDNDELVHTFR